MLPPIREDEAGLCLSAEQQFVARVVDNGDSIFFSGPAGCGKSELLRYLVAKQSKRYPNAVFVTAPTGISAVAIGGCTLHSFAGVGIGDLPVADLVRTIKKNKETLARWLVARVLFVDEVSMLERTFFEKLEEVARLVRKKPFAAFGGIQVVLCGDFFQLPPVSAEQDRFCFQSPVWNKVVWASFLLSTVFRQEKPEQVRYLNALREGVVVDGLRALLAERAVDDFAEYEDDEPHDASRVKPITLFTTNADVDALNERKLRRVLADNPGLECHRYEASDCIRLPLQADKLRAQLDKLVVPKRLSLCVGAQVMLLRNYPELDLSNGSMGVVTAIPATGKAHPVVLFESGTSMQVSEVSFDIKEGLRTVASRTALPLRLAYAITIHKSQGMTIDKLRVDLSRVFEAGMVYVALSRARDLSQVDVMGFDPSRVVADEHVKAFYAKIADAKMVRGGYYETM